MRSGIVGHTPEPEILPLLVDTVGRWFLAMLCIMDRKPVFSGHDQYRTVATEGMEIDVLKQYCVRRKQVQLVADIPFSLERAFANVQPQDFLELRRSRGGLSLTSKADKYGRDDPKQRSHCL